LSDSGHIELYAVTTASLHVTRCRQGAGPAAGAWRQWLRRLLAPHGRGYTGAGR
jgi:hypothetical protein